MQMQIIFSKICNRFAMEMHLQIIFLYLCKILQPLCNKIALAKFLVAKQLQTLQLHSNRKAVANFATVNLVANIISNLSFSDCKMQLQIQS